MMSDEEYSAADEWDMFVRAVAMVAKGEGGPEMRQDLGSLLSEFEENGWQLSNAVRQIWEGERDFETLTRDIDPNSAIIVERILDLTEKPTPAELVGSLPPGLRSAMLSDDLEQVTAEFDKLSAEEQAEVFEKFVDAGMFGPQVTDLPRMDEIVSAFEPILIAIAEVAKGGLDDEVKEEVEKELDYLKENEVEIEAQVRRIWAGERDEAALTEGLDEVDASLIKRILSLIKE